MRRVYEDSWSGLSEWATGTHAYVSERMLRLLAPLATATPLAALYFDPDSQEEPSYSCLLAANGWLHQLQASIPEGVVTLESWPLRQIENVKVTIAGSGQGIENYSVVFSVREGKQFEWIDQTNPEMGSRNRESAGSALRFAIALRAMLSST